jgi:hypothetical protein
LDILSRSQGIPDASQSLPLDRQRTSAPSASPFAILEQPCHRALDRSNVVVHPSTVATGTWSFDVYVTGDGGGIILFMLGPGRAYMIDITSDTIYLWRSGIDEEGRRVGGVMLHFPYIVRDSFSGWQHIDVTRDEYGRIRVYHEGKMVIGDLFLAIGSYDTLLTTSERFLYAAPSSGMALDNVVVSNTIDVFLSPAGRIDRSQSRFWATMVIAAVTVVAVRIGWINRANSLDSQREDNNIDSVRTLCR